MGPRKPWEHIGGASWSVELTGNRLVTDTENYLVSVDPRQIQSRSGSLGSALMKATDVTPLWRSADSEIIMLSSKALVSP